MSQDMVLALLSEKTCFFHDSRSQSKNTDLGKVTGALLGIALAYLLHAESLVVRPEIKLMPTP